MATLLLKLIGPMQSWGYKSAFKLRNTQPEPTKSGVTGLLCAALGRDRNLPLDDLTAIRMGVRVDAPGQLAYDYQTALGVAKADGSRPETQTSQRAYLADAAFWVGLESTKEQLSALHKALLNPVWPLFLGRKSYLFSQPLVPASADEAIFDVGLQAALESAPRLLVASSKNGCLKFVVECDEGEKDSETGIVQQRDDVPLSFAFGQRSFASRMVSEFWRDVSVRKEASNSCI